jgi:hypothetical protein
MHLVEKRPRLTLGQKLEASLEDSASVRVGGELEDCHRERVARSGPRFGGIEKIGARNENTHHDP